MEVKASRRAAQDEREAARASAEQIESGADVITIMSCARDRLWAGACASSTRQFPTVRHRQSWSMLCSARLADRRQPRTPRLHSALRPPAAQAICARRARHWRRAQAAATGTGAQRPDLFRVTTQEPDRAPLPLRRQHLRIMGSDQLGAGQGSLSPRAATFRELRAKTRGIGT